MDWDAAHATSRWGYAVKPKSWPKMLVPALFGQALGVAIAGRLDVAALAFGAAFTVADLLYIVLLNDWGDREVDRLKRRMFPDGCSPKTIPDGILPAERVLRAGIAAGAAAVAVSAAGAAVLGRPGFVPVAVLALAVFVAYTFPPLRLNYRGGGELLEMLGVGVILPWANAYVQSGSWRHPLLWLVVGTALLALASALASGLSDEQSDARGGKRTFTTAFGNARVRRAAELCLVAGAFAWIAASLLHRGTIPWWIVVPPACIVLWHTRRVIGASEAARTNAFRAQGAYKQELHHAVWRGTGLLAALLMMTLWIE